MEKITIQDAINEYLNMISISRAAHTARTYRNGLKAFQITLATRNISPTESMVAAVGEDSIAWFADDLKYYSSATERLYLTAVKGFFEYLASENLASPNLPRLNLLIRHRSRRPGIRLPQYPKENIALLLDYAINIDRGPTNNNIVHLRNLRDKAFLLVLADTGMRVHEVCNLRRGDMDWMEGKALIIGKGNQQAVIRFSQRALAAIKEYLSSRKSLDGTSGKPLASLPVFARHDKGAGKKVKPITTATGRNIVKSRVIEVLGAEAAREITPHSLRHYFVTTILRGSGNLKLAQELARHKSITVTQRYAHLSNDELDKGYHEIFEQETP